MPHAGLAVELAVLGYEIFGHFREWADRPEGMTPEEWQKSEDRITLGDVGIKSSNSFSNIFFPWEDLFNDEITSQEFVAMSIASALMNVPGGWLPALVIYAPIFGKQIGNDLAQQAIALMNDPNSVDGKILKKLFQALGWIPNNDPTFVTIPASPLVRLNAPPGHEISPQKKDAYTTLWLSQSTMVEGTVYDRKGEHVRDFGRWWAEPGHFRLGWNGLDDNSQPVQDGDYRMVVRTIGDLDTPPVSATVKVDTRPPKLSVNAEVKDGRIHAIVKADEDVALSWFCGEQQSDRFRALGSGGFQTTHQLQIAAYRFGATGKQILRTVGEDRAGNRAQVEVAIAIPALDSNVIVEDVRIERSIDLQPVSRGWVSEDKTPGWIAGSLPEESKQVGKWRWDREFSDPFGVPTHHSVGDGADLHYFTVPKTDWFIGPREHIIQYVWVDPKSRPQQIVMQFYTEGLNADHRVSFGQQILDLGERSQHGTVSLGQIPASGRWFRVKISADQIGLAGHHIHGILFATYGGRVCWGSTTFSDPNDAAPTVVASNAARRVIAANENVRVTFHSVRPGPLAMELVGAQAVLGRPFEKDVVTGTYVAQWRGRASDLGDKPRLTFLYGADGNQKQTVPLPKSTSSDRLIARIDFPPAGAIGRQTIPIFGQAGGARFSHYIVDYKSAAADDEAWTTIVHSERPTGIAERQVRDVIEKSMSGRLRRTIYGNLASFHTGSFNHKFAFRPAAKTLAPDRVVLRLRVFDKEQAVAEDRTELIIGEVINSAYQSVLRSPDRRAELNVPPYALPRGIGALALEKTALPVALPAGATPLSDAYRAAPDGVRLLCPAELLITVPDVEDAVIMVHQSATGWRHLPVHKRTRNGVAVKLSAFSRGASFAAVRLESIPTPELYYLRETQQGFLDVTGVAQSGLRIELHDTKGNTLRSTATRTQRHFVLRSIPLTLGDNTFAVVSKTEDGRRAVKTPLKIKRLARGDRGESDSAWTITPDPVVGQTVGVSFRSVSTDVEEPILEVASATATRQIPMFFDGEAFQGRFVPEDAGDHLLSALGQTRTVTVGLAEGPEAPLPIPEGIEQPMRYHSFEGHSDGNVFRIRDAISGQWARRFAASVNGRSDAERLLEDPFEIEKASHLKFAYRIQEGTRAQLILRSDRGVEVIPLAGARPSSHGACRVAAFTGLIADGQWHWAEIALDELLPGVTRIEETLVGRLESRAWNTTSLHGLSGVDQIDIDNLWLGSPWPVKNLKNFRVRDNAVALKAVKWSVGPNMDGDPQQSLAGSMDVVSLPELTDGLHYFSIRAQNEQGEWGTAGHWPILVDRQAPAVSDPNPDNDSISGDLQLRVKLSDSGTGVDPTTIEMQVDQVTVPAKFIRYDVVSGYASLKFGDLPRRPNVGPGTVINAAVLSVADKAGNRLATPFRWSWTMEKDMVAMGNLRMLTRSGGREAAWSPDGKHLAFISDRTGQLDLYEMELATGKIEQFTEDVAEESAPAFAPDGKRILYNKNGGISLFNRQDKSTKQIAAGLRDPHWIDDSTFIAGQGNKVVRVDLDGVTHKIFHTETGGLISAPKRNASGDIVFTHHIYHDSVWKWEHVTGRLYPLSERLDDPALREADSVWSPDGNSVSFAVRDRAPGLWTSKPDGTQRKRLLQTVGNDRRPTWSQNGEYLAFDSDRNGIRNIWLLELGRITNLSVQPDVASNGNDEPISITLEAPEHSEVMVAVHDDQGNLVRIIHPLQAADEEKVAFTWDGRRAESAALADGHYEIVAVVKDAERTLTSSVPFRLDTRPPTSTALRRSDGAEIDDWHKLPVGDSIVLKASDGETGAGIEKIEYRFDESSPWRTYREPIAVAQRTEQKLYYRSIDQLGQTEAVNTLVVTQSLPLISEETITQVAKPAPVAVLPTKDAGHWMWWLAGLGLLALTALSVHMLRRRRLQ